MLQNGSIGYFFRTTVGVRQGCQLSQVLFKYAAAIPGKDNAETFDTSNPSETDCYAGIAVEDVEETDIPLLSVSIGGRSLCHLRFADDIDLLGGSEELHQLTERLDKTAAGKGVEINSDKSKILVTIKPITLSTYV